MVVEVRCGGRPSTPPCAGLFQAKRAAIFAQDFCRAESITAVSGQIVVRVRNHRRPFWHLPSRSPACALTRNSSVIARFSNLLCGCTVQPTRRVPNAEALSRYTPSTQNQPPTSLFSGQVGFLPRPRQTPATCTSTITFPFSPSRLSIFFSPLSPDNLSFHWLHIIFGYSTQLHSSARPQHCLRSRSLISRPACHPRFIIRGGRVSPKPLAAGCLYRSHINPRPLSPVFSSLPLFCLAENDAFVYPLKSLPVCATESLRTPVNIYYSIDHLATHLEPLTP